MPGLWTIPSGLGLPRHLARVLSGLSPQELTKTVIFWPYQRALQDFTHHLGHLSGGASWLPALFTLGDVVLALQQFGCAAPSATVIPPLERLGLLAQLITQKPITLGHETQTYSFEVALTLASDLSRVLDAASFEGADLSQLSDLVPERFSHHWQITLQFLDILNDTWPALLAAKGYVNPNDALIQNTDALINHLSTHNPDFPIIIAGSTGSIPHVRRLMKAVLDLPQGAVVLPGFEPELSPDAWPATHPQRTMHTLLSELGKKPCDVGIWQASVSPANKARRALLAKTFASNDSGDFGDAALSGVSLLEADHEQEEALAIAHLIARALAESAHTSVVACVPDAALSRWVKMHLDRWGIDAAESAGTPLATHPHARLALSCLKVAHNPDDMQAFLDLLKHLDVGKAHRHKERLVRQLELTIVRADPPCLSRAMLDQRIEDSPYRARFALVVRLVDEALASLHGEGAKAAGEWCAALQNAMEVLMQAPLQSELRHGLAQLTTASEAYPPLTHEEYLALLIHVLRQDAPKASNKPRVHLLGTLEARLVQGDVMILACLNEGQWPAHTPDNPWLGRAMRQHLGLLDDVRKQSLQGHDFWSAAAAPRVILTRSKRHQDATMMPSRFLLALLRAVANKDLHLQKETTLLTTIRAMPASPEHMRPQTMPRPRPPATVLPQKISVSAVNYVQKDPYTFYARYVLGLKKIASIGHMVGANTFGNCLHSVMEELYTPVNSVASRDTFDFKQSFLDKSWAWLKPFESCPEVSIFWWRRLKRLATALSQLNKENPPPPRTLVEVWGQYAHHVGDQTVTLSARADRLDVTPEGVTIIDYKTGTLPSEAQIKAGAALQMPLEGLILSKGGFKNVPAKLAQLAFWHFGKHEITIKTIPDPTSRVQEAEEMLSNLLSPFYEGKRPFVPSFHSPFFDYAHLTRMAEWRRS